MTLTVLSAGTEADDERLKLSEPRKLLCDKSPEPIRAIGLFGQTAYLQKMPFVHVQKSRRSGSYKMDSEEFVGVPKRQKCMK